MMKFSFLSALLLISIGCSTPSFAQGAVAPHIVPAEPAPAAAASIAVPVAPPTDEPKKEIHPPSLFDEGPAQTPASLVITIRTFRNNNAVDVVSASPYPVRPPKATKPMSLPEKGKYLRSILLMVGYQTPTNVNKPYPAGGLRMLFALHEAARKSGIGYPHGILTEYQWADEIMPYAVKEVHHWNEVEQERWERYERMVHQFETDRVELEAQAVRMGLSPVPFPRREPGALRGKLDPGNWWVTCTRKVPGLVYYWQIPITLAAGDHQTLNLNDNNALLITGAW